MTDKRASGTEIVATMSTIIQHHLWIAVAKTVQGNDQR